MHLLSALRTTRRKGVLGRPQPPSHLVYRGLIIVTRENARSAADEECGAVLVRQHGIIFADVAVDCYRHIIAERGPQFAHTPSRMGNPALAGEPGFDRHHQEVRQGQVKYRSEGGERVDGDARCHPGLGNRRCKSKRVRFCFDVKIIHFRAGFRERSYVVGGVADHHMNMKRQLSGSSKGSYCAGPNVRFGTKCPSMMSTWMESTPASSSFRASWPKAQRSAHMMEAEIWAGFNLELWGTSVGR